MVGPRTAGPLGGSRVIPRNEMLSQRVCSYPKAELDALDVGDAVFHKAFGYGEVVDLSDKYVMVSFENDNHKKRPFRQFGFPGAFYQGLLRIV